MNKMFFKGSLVCETPFAIGSGKSDYTDTDVLFDCNGKPFIPGTTLAGVCRHYLEDCGYSTDSLFGYISYAPEKQNEEQVYPRSESRIIFYEGFLKNNFKKSVRDGVAIENGVAKDGAKYDYEIIEAGCKFEFRFEIDNCNEDDLNMVSALINGFNNGTIRIGHKSNRGLGKFSVENLKSQKITSINELIDFEWASVSDSFVQSTTEVSSFYEYTYNFRVKAFVMIANNATLEKKDGKIIHAEPLKNANNTAVVPGSSWAGVIRSYFKRILDDIGYANVNSFLEKLFGSTEQASRIIFNESVIDDAVFINQTRNAIDRFTGGASDKKLFTNQLAFGGKVKLVIHLKKNELNDEELKLTENLIKLAIEAFNDGYLTIGGLGSVGGGILSEMKEGDANA